MSDYLFSGAVSDEAVRQRLVPYGFGLLKITNLTKQIKDFVSQTYLKYKAEGE